MAGLPFLPAILSGLGNAVQWVYGGLTAPGSCSTWTRIKSIFQNTCFAAGTPLLTPDGSKPIEQFKVGDFLLSRDENDPLGPISPKVVEEVFVRTGQILHVHVRGQVIRTTPEHPFWVNGRGWLPAGCLCVGDLLYSHDGNWLPVEDLYNGGESETVYNLRVADHHTYFVGSQEWGWSVWVHNARCRHFTSEEGLAGIQQSQSIKISRGGPGIGVDVEVQPFGPVKPFPNHTTPGAQLGAGSQLSTDLSTSFVEFDLPTNAIPTPWVSQSRNTARIPTDSSGLPLAGLNPSFQTIHWWQFWKWLW